MHGDHSKSSSRTKSSVNAFKAVLIQRAFEIGMPESFTYGWTTPSFEFVHSLLASADHVAQYLNPSTEITDGPEENTLKLYPFNKSADTRLKLIRLCVPQSYIINTALPLLERRRTLTALVFALAWQAASDQLAKAAGEQQAAYARYRARCILRTYADLMRVGFCSLQHAPIFTDRDSVLAAADSVIFQKRSINHN